MSCCLVVRRATQCPGTTFVALVSLCGLVSCGKQQATSSLTARVASADSRLFIGPPEPLQGSCVRGFDAPRAPHFSRAGLPASVLLRFAVLRRPRGRQDRLPASSTSTLRADGLQTVYAKYVRRIGRIANGSSYFLVPATVRVRFDRRCMSRLSSARRVRQTRHLRRLQRTLFLFLDNFDNGGGSYAYPAADALAGRAFASSDGPEPAGADPTRIPVSNAVLAPDGAASVESQFPGAPPIIATVSHNFATFVRTMQIKPDARRFPNFNPDIAIFRRADGSVLLRSRPPVDAPAFGE